MKYELSDAKKMLRLIPEDQTDIFRLGQLWAKHGGKIMWKKEVDEPREIEFYELILKEISEILAKS